MSAADIIVVAVVASVFALCVRSIVKSQKSGECADCASGGSCSAHKGGGHCKESAKLMANAAAAVSRYEANQGK